MTGMTDSFISRLNKNSIIAWALVALVISIRLSLTPRITDDAYITFRYAENLSKNIGFVYNQGERVLGTTTPLFAYVLSLIQRLTALPVGSIAHWISTLADGVSVWMLFKLGRSLFQDMRIGLGAGVLFAISPLVIRFSISGMETSLAVAWMLASLYCYFLDRVTWATIFAALGYLTRPELILLVLLFAIDLIKTGARRRAFVMVLGVFSLLLPWLLFSWSYFGSPIPNSMLAKSAQVYQWSAHQTVSMFLSHLAFLFLGYPIGRFAGVAWPGAVPDLSSQSGWIIAILLGGIQLLIMVRGMTEALQNERRSMPFVVFPILYLGLYLSSAVRKVLIFDWYLGPINPFYYLFLVGGFISVLRRFTLQRFEPLLIGALACALLTGLSLKGPEIAFPLDTTVGRETEYRMVAELFKEEFDSDSVVAAGEIGALGYFSDARILDTVGLVSPIALNYYPISQELYSVSYAIPPELIRDVAPEYLVTMEVFITKGLMSCEWFSREYEEVYRESTNAFRGTELLVFRRIEGHE